MISNNLTQILLAAIAAVVSLATLGTTIFLAIKVKNVDGKVDRVEGVVNSKNTIQVDTIEALKLEVSRLNSDRHTRTPAATAPGEAPAVGMSAGHVSVSKVEPEGG